MPTVWCWLSTEHIIDSCNHRYLSPQFNKQHSQVHKLLQLLTSTLLLLHELNFSCNEATNKDKYYCWYHCLLIIWLTCMTFVLQMTVHSRWGVCMLAEQLTGIPQIPGNLKNPGSMLQAYQHPRPAPACVRPQHACV